MYQKTKTSGFTIVELLIVIVVIAILATITIVAFNGVSARASSTSAQATASTVLEKIELYHAEYSSYIDNTSQLTSSDQSNQPWFVAGVDFTENVIDSKPSRPATINVFACASGGMQVGYWKYSDPSGLQKVSTGNTTSCSDTPIGTIGL